MIQQQSATIHALSILRYRIESSALRTVQPHLYKKNPRVQPLWLDCIAAAPLTSDRSSPMDTGEALDASAEPAAIAPELPLSNVSLFKGAQDRPFLQETVSPVPSTSRNSYSVSLRPDDHDIQNVGRAHGRGRNKGESADDSGTRSHAFVTKVAVKSERKKTSTSNAAHSRSPEGDKSVRPKRKRISQDQLNVLLNLFTQTDTPSFELRENVAQQLGMSNREVQVSSCHLVLFSCEGAKLKVCTGLVSKPSCKGKSESTQAVHSPAGISTGHELHGTGGRCFGPFCYC